MSEPRDQVLLSEYVHGDNGAGPGASRQTRLPGAYRATIMMKFKVLLAGVSILLLKALQ